MTCSMCRYHQSTLALDADATASVDGAHPRSIKQHRQFARLAYSSKCFPPFHLCIRPSRLSGSWAIQGCTQLPLDGPDELEAPLWLGLHLRILQLLLCEPPIRLCFSTSPAQLAVRSRSLSASAHNTTQHTYLSVCTSSLQHWDACKRSTCDMRLWDRDSQLSTASHSYAQCDVLCV